MSREHLQSLAQRQWFPVTLPQGLAVTDCAQLLVACGQVLTLRVTRDALSNLQLEVFCTPGEEHARAEMMAQQAAADQVLRQIIRSQSDPDISALVDGVLSRAVRG